MDNLLILSTAYVTPQDGDPYWEIIAAPDRDYDAPRLLLWTADDTIARAAIAVEGTARRVALDTRTPGRDTWREIVGIACQ
jgi:hypothetical protein